MDLWDSIQQVIFEQGVTLKKQGDGSWNCESSINSDLLLTPSLVENKFGLRPIVITNRPNAPDESWSTVIPANGGRLLGPVLSDLQQLIYSQKSGNWFLTTRSLFYLLFAVLYHCKQLARLYAKNCSQCRKLPFVVRGDRFVQQVYECHFEFEALITAIIRTFDMERYSLWNAYGSKGSVPNSFVRTVRNCSKLPPELQRRLEQSSNSYLTNAKEYRDCIQHYVDVGSSSWSMMSKLNRPFWGMIARIPDNPEKKSAREFKFRKDIDALTYGWELTTELFEVTNLIFHTIFDQKEV